MKKETFFSKMRDRRRIKQLEKKIEEKTKEYEAKKQIKEEIKEKEETKEIKEPKEKKTGLTTRLDDMSEKLDRITQETKTKEKLKKKVFKLPFGVKSQLKKLAKKSKVQVLLLQNNRNIKATIGEMRDGMLLVGQKIYNGAANIVWLWNGKFPTAIVPEWDLQPLTPEGLHKEAVEGKRLAHPQTMIIRAIEFKEAMTPKKLGGKTLILLIIGGVIVIYILFAGGGGG